MPSSILSQNQLNQELLNLITENLPDMLWIKDIEGRYIYTNKAICDNLLMAKDTAEPIGKNDVFFALREREAHADKPEWHTFGELCHNSDELIFENNKPMRFEEYGNIKGKLVYLEVHKAPFYDKDGNIMGTVGTGRDITEIIEAHEKIKEKTEALIKKDKQLFLQSKFAQMGEMLSMIVHQWRQPLSAISSTSANIVLKARSNKLDKETTIKLAERISLYSQHLNSTIDDFRDFFKSDKEKEEITYTKIIQNVLQIVEVSLINKNINLVQILNCEDTFNTYPNELKQVILNIIKNAEDILMEKKIKNPTITIETSCGLLTISDNAGGIQEDIINHVFDPYFSTKLEKDGTGIGLYMSKTIIEEHCNGKLSVSNGKEGAIFTIKL